MEDRDRRCCRRLVKHDRIQKLLVAADRPFAGNYSSNLHEREQHRCYRRNLRCAKSHKIDNELCDAAGFLRNAVAKAGEHSVLERGIRLFVREFFFQNFVHNFVFLMGLAAARAFDQMGVQGILFLVRKLAVQIGGEVVVDFVVNRHGCSEARAGFSCLRMVASARPRIPRSEPFVRPSRFSIVA